MKGISDTFMRRGCTVAAAVGAVLISASAFSQPRGVETLPADAIIEPASSAIAKCFNSGTGIKAFSWCVTEHGNIQFGDGGETIIPANYEGYAVCSATGTHGYDRGGVEGPWGATTVTYPSGTTAQVTRFTSDGRLRLDMKFSRDTAEFDATIQTTVTNVGATTLNSVLLTRYAGGGDPGFSGPWGRTDFANYAIESPTRAVALAGLSVGASGITHTMYNNYDLNGGWSENLCVSPTLPQPATEQACTSNCSYTVLRSVYDLGNLGPGQKKVVKQQYRRM